jgi:hypothetical protein
VLYKPVTHGKHREGVVSLMRKYPVLGVFQRWSIHVNHVSLANTSKNEKQEVSLSWFSSVTCIGTQQSQFDQMHG